MKKLDCFNCHGTCGCHKEGNKSMVGCTCPFNGPLVQIAITKGCPWCLGQIREDEYNDHPRNCVFYQEYLRQII